MNFRILFPLTLVIIICSCASTNKVNKTKIDSRYVDRYQDKLDSESTLIGAGYHFTLEKLSDTVYVYKQYYPETRQIIKRATYKEKYLYSLHGPYITWLDNGSKFEEGSYREGKKTGKWEVYDVVGGSISEEGRYIRGLKSGVWSYYYATGNIAGEFIFEEGELDGGYRIFGDNGEVIQEGEFKGGQKEYITRDPMNVLENHQPPHLKKCDGADDPYKCTISELLRVYSSNISYPGKARSMGIEGIALVSFIVNEDGDVVNLKVQRSLCGAIKNELEFSVALMPEWKPAKEKGEPVDQDFLLPVRFTIR